MAIVLASPGFWLRDSQLAIDWKRVLHGEERIELHALLAAAGTVKSHLRVTGVEDKGVERGTVIYSDRTLIDEESDACIVTIRETTFARGDGGGGGLTRHDEWHPQTRPADAQLVLSTQHNSALIYRLTGDRNPLHAEPAVAREAGFGSSILHGLCTLGVVAQALVGRFADYDASRLRNLSVRFSAPVTPGDRTTTTAWQDRGELHFEAGTDHGPVLTRWHAEIRPPSSNPDFRVVRRQ